MRREDPLHDDIDTQAKRKQTLRPKDVMRLREQLRRLPEGAEEFEVTEKQRSNGKGQKPIAAKKEQVVQPRLVDKIEQPVLQPKDPSVPDFAFTESELALIDGLSSEPLPNTLGLTDRGYMQRLLGGIDAIEGMPTESGMLHKAKVDYGAYKKFLTRNTEMEPLLKKRRIGKVHELKPQMIFHYKTGHCEQWLKEAVGERKRYFILGTLKVAGGESALGKFPTSGAIEGYLGMTGKSLSDFVAAPPEWQAQFQQAMILWVQIAPAKDFLTGFKFGELDDYMKPACALRFTELQVAAIKELERIPSDASISERMTEKYGATVPAHLIIMHRKWLEENRKKKECTAQLEAIEQAKLELVRGLGQPQQVAHRNGQTFQSGTAKPLLASDKLVQSLDAVRVSPAMERAKYERFAQILIIDAHRKGLITLRELSESVGTNTGTLRNLRINYPKLWVGVEQALAEEAVQRQEFVKANVAKLANALRYILRTARNDALICSALGVSEVKIENARKMLGTRPAEEQLANFFHSFDARRVLAFGAALSFFNLLPFQRQVILDTTEQHFVSLAARASGEKHEVKTSHEGGANIVCMLLPFVSNEAVMVETINSMPNGSEMFFFSCDREVDRHALKEIGASGFGLLTRETNPMLGAAEKLSFSFVILRKTDHAPTLEKIPQPFRLNRFVAPITSIADKRESLTLVRRAHMTHPAKAPALLKQKA